MASIKRMKAVENTKKDTNVRKQFEAYMLDVGFTDWHMRRDHADIQYLSTTVHHMWEGFCAALTVYEVDIEMEVR